MNLVDVDVIGSKPAQGILDLAQNPGTAGIAEYSSVLPFQPGLGGNKHARAQSALSNCLADELFRPAEPVSRSGINDIDAVIDRIPDRRDRFGFISATPHPASDSPGADRHTRYAERCAGYVGMLHVQVECLRWRRHGPLPFVSTGVVYAFVKLSRPCGCPLQALRNLGLTEMRRLWRLAAIDPLLPGTTQSLLYCRSVGRIDAFHRKRIFRRVGR